MRSVRVLGCVFAVAALAACSRQRESEKAASASAPRASVPVKLLLNWVPEPEFGGFYAAREGGAFTRNGLDVEILGGGGGTPVVQMVAQGQADFGISEASEVLSARAQGADVLPLFAVFQTNPQGIMAHASRGAKNLAGVLTSGTLALEPGLPYASFLKKKYGFDHVKIVPYDGGVAHFVADKDFAQQCFITSEPIAARRQGADPEVFLVADEGFNPYATVVVTRRALWQKEPERVRAFVRAVREGWRAYLDNPGPSNAFMGKLNPTMDAQTFAAAAEAQKRFIETGETQKAGLGVMTRERWETLARELVELGIIKKAPQVDEFLLPELTLR